MGKAIPRPDLPLKVDGTAHFGIDVKVPGMLYATIERPQAIYGKVAKLDDSRAKAVTGVKHVVLSERKMPHRTSQGVAVLAENCYAALQGRKALAITWETAEAAELNTTAYFDQLKELARKEGAVLKEKCDLNQQFSLSVKKLEAQYETPFLTHAPMEPENAVAHVTENACEIWAPIQGPDWVISEVSKYLGISPD